MSSGFDSSSMNQKYEMSKPERLQGATGMIPVAAAAESLKTIAQLTPYTKTSSIRYPVLPSAALIPAVQMITMSASSAAAALSAPILPKIAVCGSLGLQSGASAVVNAVERCQQQPASPAPSPAAVTVAVPAAAATSTFSTQPAAQQPAISIIRPSAPMHTAATGVVANIYASGCPRVVTTDTKKTITAPRHGGLLPTALQRLASSPLPNLTVATTTQVPASLSVAAIGTPQLLLSSQHSTAVQPPTGLRNLSQHSLRPSTPPSSGKLSVTTTLGTLAADRLSADHHRFTSTAGQNLSSTGGSGSPSIPITPVMTSVPLPAASSTVQITIHQPKATALSSAAVVDRLPFARLPPATGLSLPHAPRLVIPPNINNNAASQHSSAQLPTTSAVTLPRAVPVISLGTSISTTPMVVTAAGAVRSAAQRNAGQHDYSRHEPGSAMPVYESLSKPHAASLPPAVAAQVAAECFSGRVSGSSAVNNIASGVPATVAATTVIPAYLAQEQLYPAAPALTSVGFIGTSQQQFLAQPSYARGQPFRTTIYPSPQPSMSAIVSSTSTRTALLLPAMNTHRSTSAATVFYGQNGADDASAHNLSTMGSVIVPNTACGLQQTSTALPPSTVIGSSSPRPSILRKRTTADGGVTNNALQGARRVLPIAELASFGTSLSGAKIISESSSTHSRADSPKLPQPMSICTADRAPISRRSSTDTATDPALSIESLSPTSVKQEPVDIHENGLPGLPAALSASADVSPRKKPRKQLLNTVNDYKEEDYSTEEETETKGLHPISQLRQPYLRDSNKHDRQIVPVSATSAPDVSKPSSTVAAKPQSKRPSAANADDERSLWTPIKRPRMQLLDSYKRAYPWKSQNNHFVRYSDVKAKEESRLTVSELSNKRGVTKCASGWRLYHIAAQFDEVSQSENDLHDRLHEMQRMLMSTSFQQRGSGRHSLDTGIAADVSRVSELAEACKQRCVLVQSQLKDAREAMLMVLKHKTVIMDIISKHHCRRTVKKKERT